MPNCREPAIDHPAKIKMFGKRNFFLFSKRFLSANYEIKLELESGWKGTLALLFTFPGKDS